MGEYRLVYFAEAQYSIHIVDSSNMWP